MKNDIMSNHTFDIKFESTKPVMDDMQNINFDYNIIENIINKLESNNVLYRLNKIENLEKRYEEGIKISGLFSIKWYYENYPDVAQANIDAVEHYVKNGVFENRNPNSWFSTNYYINEYPDISKKSINPFFHYIYYGHKEGLKPHFINESSITLIKMAEKARIEERFDEAIKMYAKACEESKTIVPVEWIQAQADIHMKLKHYEEAESLYNNILDHYHDNLYLWEKLGDSLRFQGKWLQAINAYENATKYNENIASIFFSLGLAYEYMNWWDKAATAFEKGINIDSTEYQWHYHLGYVLERNGDILNAKNSYKNAIERDNKYNSKKFGIGILHTVYGNLQYAKKSYKEILSKNIEYDIQEKYSIICIRCSRFDSAIKSTMSQLDLLSETEDKKNRSECWYRIGICYEKLNKYQEALLAYCNSLEIQPINYIYYRVGYLLYKLGDFKSSCEAFINIKIDHNDSCDYAKNDFCDFNFFQTECTINISNEERLSLLASSLQNAIKKDTTNPYTFYQLANIKEKLNDIKGATIDYQQCAVRLNDNDQRVWYALGKNLFKEKKYKESSEAFLYIENLREPYFVNKGFYNNNLSFKIKADYLECCKHLPIEDNIILYENQQGVSVGDNPAAIFFKILKDSKFKNFKHIWVINNSVKIPDFLKTYKNVIFIKYQSWGYLRYLATSHYLINNTTFPPYFIRRDGQFYINTWHGTPLKNMGKDVVNDPIGFLNTTRNFIHASLLIHPNKYTANIMLQKYNIENIAHHITKVTGYPRNDALISISETEKNKIRKKIGIFNNKKIILYAPTWRGVSSSSGLKIDNSFNIINEVINICQQFKNYNILFRGHHLQERFLDFSPNCKIVNQSIDTNLILSVTDVLITDYSSISIDFLNTRREIIFYCPDEKDYIKSRGLYIKPSLITNNICRTPIQLYKILNNISRWRPDNKYLLAVRSFCSHEDGNSSKRVVNLIKNFRTHTNKAQKKKKILIYIDMLKSGIGTSCCTLCKYIDKNIYDIYLLINNNLFNKSQDVRDMLTSRLDKSCKIIPSSRNLNLTIEEKVILSKYEKERRIDTDYEKHLIGEIYSREWKRLFSNHCFDCVIDYTGYAAFQTELFAYANTKCKKIIFYHSDLIREKNVRFPYLERTLISSKYYDEIVFVTRAIMDEIGEELCKKYNLDKKKFRVVHNLIDVDRVIRLSKEKLLYRDLCLFENSKNIFVSVGRLSPEKNYELLIDAFSDAILINQNMKLIIVGDGPLKDILNRKIINLNIKDHVKLLGFRDNPFNIVKKADYYIQTSIYEGQGLSLLEALTLKKVCIATDIPAFREILGNGKFGMLVKNNKNSICKGILDMVNNYKSHNFQFDYNLYNKKSISEFYKIIKR